MTRVDDYMIRGGPLQTEVKGSQFGSFMSTTRGLPLLDSFIKGPLPPSLLDSNTYHSNWNAHAWTTLTKFPLSG